MKIGLTYTGYEHKHQNYLQWLKGGDDIEIVTLSADKQNAIALRECDGLVLSGGIDIQSGFYKGPEEYPNKPGEGWNMARDSFEQELYEYAINHEMPILAVCRGLQLVNVLQGGTLKQDLGALNDTHKAVAETDRSHEVNVVNDTVLSEVVAVPSGKVNSAHHQAIENLGDGLKINCRATDGTIEGAEWADKKQKPFLLCIQWHPERMYKLNLDESPLSKNIRNRFIVEIVKSKSAK